MNTATKATVSTKAAVKVTPELDTIDREDIAAEAGYLADVVEWMVQAHATLHQLRSVADIQPKFGHALRELAIPIRSPDLLDQNVVSGISMILMRQRELIAQLSGVQP